MHTHSPDELKEFKQISARKLIAALFWDRKGMVMVELMQQGTTMMSHVFQNTKEPA
jgi:hypothetical protein